MSRLARACIGLSVGSLSDTKSLLEIGVIVNCVRLRVPIPSDICSLVQTEVSGLEWPPVGLRSNNIYMSLYMMDVHSPHHPSQVY